MVTEEAFRQLKGRWRVLLRKNESSPSEVKMAALACIILHNKCIEKEDFISRCLDLSLDPSTNTGAETYHRITSHDRVQQEQ